MVTGSEKARFDGGIFRIWVVAEQGSFGSIWHTSIPIAVPFPLHSTSSVAVIERRASAIRLHLQFLSPRIFFFSAHTSGGFIGEYNQSALRKTRVLMQVANIVLNIVADFITPLVVTTQRMNERGKNRASWIAASVPVNPSWSATAVTTSELALKGIVPSVPFQTGPWLLV